MKILDCGRLSVCDDCLILIANDDDSGATPGHRERFAAWQAEYGDGATLVPEYDAEPDEFSARRCDGCGTTLAGRRSDVVALVND